MLSVVLFIKTTIFSFIGWFLYWTFKRVAAYLSVAHIQGPPSTDYIVGCAKETHGDDRAAVVNQWMEKYGKVFATWGLLGEKELYLADVKGLSHVLKHDTGLYQKSKPVGYLLERITGHGLLVREGQEHRKQRRVMNPAFGPAQIRGLTTIFFEKSFALRDLWASRIEENPSGHIEVLSWLSRMTMDVIGQAGFSYQFDALTEKPNDLNSAYGHIFKSGNIFTVPFILKLMFPILRNLPEHDKSFRNAQETTLVIGKELLKASQEATKSETSSEKDLLSLMVRSNMSREIPKSERMSDDEVLSQVPTFLVAGHETTSTGTSWALYLLASYPEYQVKLREELKTLTTETPSMDELNSLPYLDSIVRETLRLLAPVPITIRIPTRDDVIPLEQSYVDRYGREHHELRVKAGQVIVIPLLALNKDKSLWGADADEFRPERWNNLPEAVTSIPGVWGNMMTFFGGPRSCIGWRFSLVEMKALLFTLVRAFEFELAVPKEEILIKRAVLVNRPMVQSTKKNELPMLIKPVSSDL